MKGHMRSASNRSCVDRHANHSGTRDHCEGDAQKLGHSQTVRTDGGMMPVPQVLRTCRSAACCNILLHR